MHYDEIINAVNSKKTAITLQQSYAAYVPQHRGYTLGYSHKRDGYLYLSGGAVTYIENKGVRIEPLHMTYQIDRRKKKLFKFEDYADAYMLADDLIAYIQDALDNYGKVPLVVKQIQKKIDKEVIKQLMLAATYNTGPLPQIKP